MTKTYFAVSALHRKIGVEVFGMPQDVELSWDEGMIGCMSVFKTRDAAEKAAEARGFDVIELRVEVAG